MSEKIITGFINHYPDIWFTIVGFVYSHSVEFMVFEIEAHEPPINAETGKGLYWHREGANAYPDNVQTLPEAEVFFEGWIKWDGCSDWDMGASYHFCTKEQAMRLGVLMGLMYNLTEKHCPGWFEL